VPGGFDENGLPIGVQFVGGPWDDGVVLGLGQFVAAGQFVRQRPIPYLVIKAKVAIVRIVGIARRFRAALRSVYTVPMIA
jgi:hypothetical protein